jgi:hypothetical protein
MQAAQFSIYARDKYDQLIGKGDAALRRTTELPAGSITRLPVLLQAHGHYSAAWGLADLATTSSPSKDYTAWSTRRTAGQRSCAGSPGADREPDRPAGGRVSRLGVSAIVLLVGLVATMVAQDWMMHNPASSPLSQANAEWLGNAIALACIAGLCWVVGRGLASR